MDILRKLDSISDDKKIRDGFRNVLSAYLNPAYGSMSKRDFDILLFIELQKMEIIPQNPEIYDLVSGLKVTRTKARNLLYESKLRIMTSSELDDELRNIIVKPIFLKDGDKISLEIGNPYLIDHMRSKLKQLGHITDGSFSSELVKLTTDAYIELFYSMLGEERRIKDIERKLIDCGAKADTSIKGVLESIVVNFAKKAGGSVVEELVGDVTRDYLTPIMDNVIDTSSDLIKKFIEGNFGSTDSSKKEQK